MVKGNGLTTLFSHATTGTGTLVDLCIYPPSIVAAGSSRRAIPSCQTDARLAVPDGVALYSALLEVPTIADSS